MKAEVVLKMIEDGEIEELKSKLRDEIYKKELGGTDVKKRYTAMKRYFKFTNKRNPMTSKPAENVRFNGDSWNAFCDSYSIVITKESLGELERIDAAVDNYLDIENLMKAMNSLPCENICVSQLIAEAKGRGYKYKKSEIPDSGDFGYAVKYKDAYFKVGILDQAFSIINDGEPAEVYYGGAKGVTFIVTSIGIAGVLPFHPQNVNMKNKKVIVCE